MIRVVLIALSLALGAGQAVAQQAEQARPPATYSQSQLWSRGDGRISFRLARISLADRAGAVSFHETAELGQPGRGIDNAIQYRSGDQQVYATVYFYFPPIAHPGLAAYATEQGLDYLSEGALQRVRAGSVPVGGIAGGAIRIDYRGYRRNLASSAAFLKVGRWMVKLRVSGPEARRAEVEATMTALLDSFRFEGEQQPRAVTLPEIGACTSVPTNAARPLLDGMDSIADAMLTSFDPLGEAAPREGGGDPIRIFARVGDGWCLSTRARIGNQIVPILRAVGTGPSGTDRVNGRTVAIGIISDSGRLIETVQAGEHRFVMFHHQIGETVVLGAYNSPPTDEQIAAMLSGADRDGGRIRARVGLRPEGGTDIELQAPPTPATRPST
jgi:hypothetical protein